MVKYLLALGLALVFMDFAAAGALEQTIYKWTDVDGSVHYDTVPPPAKVDAIKLHSPLAVPATNAASSNNINSDLQKAVADRIDRERTQRQEAERRAAQIKMRAEQDAALQDECERAGRSYCDDLEKIHANEMRHAQERQKRHQRAVREAANVKN